MTNESTTANYETAVPVTGEPTTLPKGEITSTIPLAESTTEESSSYVPAPSTDPFSEPTATVPATTTASVVTEPATSPTTVPEITAKTKSGTYLFPSLQAFCSSPLMKIALNMIKDDSINISFSAEGESTLVVSVKYKKAMTDAEREAYKNDFNSAKSQFADQMKELTDLIVQAVNVDNFQLKLRLLDNTGALICEGYVS